MSSDVSREEALQKAEELRSTLQRRLNVTPFLSGSMATGLNLPGKYDYDYGVRVTSLPKFQRLVEKLERSEDVTPSKYDRPNTDYRVFSGNLGGQPIDLALMYGHKGLQAREGVARAAKYVQEMPEEERNKILETKARLKQLSALPVVGGLAHDYLEKPWKRSVDQTIGLVRMKREALPSLEKASSDNLRRLERPNVFGHRTDNLTPIIESGRLLSAAEAGRRGLVKTVESGLPFLRGRKEFTEPAELRSEVFITKGLLPADATYGRYGVLFEKNKVEKSPYLNLIPEEHVTDRVSGKSMTFVVPDEEHADWSAKFPDRKIIAESQVPESRRLPSRSVGALLGRIASGPALRQKRELVDPNQG